MGRGLSAAMLSMTPELTKEESLKKKKAATPKVAPVKAKKSPKKTGNQVPVLHGLVYKTVADFIY